MPENGVIDKVSVCEKQIYIFSDLRRYPFRI